MGEIKCYFYSPGSASRLRDIETYPALCSDGGFEEYIKGVDKPLIFKSGYFLFKIPSPEGEGQLVRLSVSEKKKLLPRYSEELCVNYSLLEDDMLLWEDGRSIKAKLRIAGKYGIGAAFIPEEFIGDFQAPKPPPRWSPNRWRSG